MPESVQEDREWPEVWLIREPDHKLPYGGWHLGNPDEGVTDPHDEAQRYVPESSPNVLSVEEARKLVAEIDPVDRDVRRIKDRLTDWAEEASK